MNKISSYFESSYKVTPYYPQKTRKEKPVLPYLKRIQKGAAKLKIEQPLKNRVGSMWSGFLQLNPNITPEESRDKAFIAMAREMAKQSTGKWIYEPVTILQGNRVVYYAKSKNHSTENRKYTQIGAPIPEGFIDYLKSQGKNYEIVHGHPQFQGQKEWAVLQPLSAGDVKTSIKTGLTTTAISVTFNKEENSLQGYYSTVIPSDNPETVKGTKADAARIAIFDILDLMRTQSVIRPTIDEVITEMSKNGLEESQLNALRDLLESNKEILERHDTFVNTPSFQERSHRNHDKTMKESLNSLDYWHSLVPSEEQILKEKGIEPFIIDVIKEKMLEEKLAKESNSNEKPLETPVKYTSGYFAI